VSCYNALFLVFFTTGVFSWNASRSFFRSCSAFGSTYMTLIDSSPNPASSCSASIELRCWKRSLSFMAFKNGLTVRSDKPYGSKHFSGLLVNPNLKPMQPTDRGRAVRFRRPCWRRIVSRIRKTSVVWLITRPTKAGALLASTGAALWLSWAQISGSITLEPVAATSPFSLAIECRARGGCMSA